MRRPSPQTVAVLAALAADPAAWRHGYELGRQVGLKAGSLYPILMRLSDRGLLEAAWEQEPPQGRPARHLYRLTRSGLDLATSLAAAPVAPAGRARPSGPYMWMLLLAALTSLPSVLGRPRHRVTALPHGDHGLGVPPGGVPHPPTS